MRFRAIIDVIKVITKDASSPLILKSSFIVILGLGISAVTEVIKDSIIASYYGANSNIDAFFIAVITPLTLSTIIWTVANVSLVPVFSELIDEKGDAVRSLATKVAVILVGGVSILLIPIWLLANSIMKLLALGLGGDSFILSVVIFKLVLPIIVFAPIGGVGIAYLNSRKVFFFPALNNSIRNLIIIFSVLFFCAGNTVFLTISIIVAIGIANFSVWTVIYFPSKAKHTKMRWGSRHIRRSLKQMVIPFGGLTVNNSITIIEQIIATSLESGSVALINFGSKLPLGISSLIASAFSSGSLPHFSSLTSQEKKAHFYKVLRISMKIALLLGVPIGTLFIALSPGISHLLFGWGEFATKDVFVVGNIMSIYAFSIMFSGIHSILMSSLYAYQDTKTPAYHLTLVKIINIILAVLFVRVWGLYGLGLASATASFFAITRIIWIIRKKHSYNIITKELLLYAGKIFAAAIIASLSARALSNSILTFKIQSLFLQRFLNITISGFLGLFVYLLFSYLLGIREWIDFIKPKL